MANKSKKNAELTPDVVEWPFGRKNYILFGIALAVMILGFVLLGQGSEVMAPLLLVLAFVVLVPAAILIKDQKIEESANDEDSDEE